MNKSNALWILSTCIIVIGVVIYIVIGIKNERITNSKQSDNYKNTNNLVSSSNSSKDNSYNSPSSSTTTYNSPSSSTSTYNSPSSRTSTYKGNQLPNGSSPFDNCFGRGIYGGNATLTIENGSKADAIVCLYNVQQNRTIRNEYVQKNSSFTMDKISQGYYKIRVLYGNDWNPTLTNSCGANGNFESDVSFSEFDKEQYFEDSYDGYTVATITLYTVANGNVSTSRINQSDFFNN